MVVTCNSEDIKRNRKFSVRLNVLCGMARDNKIMKHFYLERKTICIFEMVKTVHSLCNIKKYSILLRGFSYIHRKLIKSITKI